MKKRLFVFVLCVISLATTCFAEQLTSDKREYYDNLRNCTPMQKEPFAIYGFENNQCKVVMTMRAPANSKMQDYVFTYKYPREVLDSLVNDAINMNEQDFKSKWGPKEEQFCESIKYGNRIIFSK